MSAQDNPLGRLVRWPVDCRHGQGIAFVSGALAGAVTGWFVYNFVATGVFACASNGATAARASSLGESMRLASPMIDLASSTPTEL